MFHTIYLNYRKHRTATATSNLQPPDMYFFCAFGFIHIVGLLFRQSHYSPLQIQTSPKYLLKKGVLDRYIGSEGLWFAGRTFLDSNIFELVGFLGPNIFLGVRISREYTPQRIQKILKRNCETLEKSRILLATRSPHPKPPTSLPKTRS